MDERFKKSTVINCDFPIIVFDNFLNHQESISISEEILKQTNFDGKVMGGRNIIYNSSEKYKKLLENKYINDLNFFLNDYKTFNYLFNELINSNNRKINFNPTNIPKKYKLKKSKGIIKYLDKLYNRFSNGYAYLEMDYSNAEKGYEIEPHHDKKERILNFLLYFNSLEEKDGGALEIYKYKSSEINEFHQKPSMNNLELQKKIRPVKNQLIVFLSTPNSVHGVEKFISKDKNRIFAYGSYTSSKKIIWKKQ